MSAKVIMVTGGQRSGKSLFAERLALSMSSRPTYLATAQVLDEDMRQRVIIHQQRRKDFWRNIEEPFELSKIVLSENEVILVDCLTLWATNWFFKTNCDVQAAMTHLSKELKHLLAQTVTLILVTNEIGLGGVSENSLQRKFTDLQGLINQFVASVAQEVYLIISGIPIKIKPKFNEFPNQTH